VVPGPTVPGAEYPWHDHRVDRRPAIREFQRRPEHEYLSDGITESIINAFSQLPALRVMARATVFRYKGKDVDPHALDRTRRRCRRHGQSLQQGDTW
jgi:hypothetical protein